MWRKRRHKIPFYRRAWFLTLIVFILIAAVASGLVAFYFQQEYSAKAATLDLSKLQDMETASIVYDRNGQVLGKIYIQNRDTISINDMPYKLVLALVGAEDNRFFQHHGIDYVGMMRAILKNWRAGKIRQGASTVTQQLARNSYPDVLPSTDRSFHRKMLEAFVALRIEQNYTKQQILEFYLNRVYFGAGFYGAEAAARGYFGKSAKQLSLSECATLTGLLRSPNNLSPWRNRQACVDARNFVLGRMLEQKLIEQSDYEKAMSENLAVKNRTATFSESYAVEFVRQQVANLIGDDDSVYGDGYRIYTTLDAGLQQTAEESLKARLERIEQRRDYDRQYQTYAQYDAQYRLHRKRQDTDPMPGPAYLQGAVYALDNATGGILTLVGGRDFAHNQFNRALLSNRRAGTAFLPIVYAAAFEKGIFPGSLFLDGVIDNRFVMIGGMTGILGEWGVERDDNQFEGPISAHSALMKSKNAATVRVGMATGLETVLEMAKKAGIDNELKHFASTYLGNSEVTLADLTLSYTMIANAGERPAQAFVIERVVQKDGKMIYQHPALRKKPVIQPSTAYEVHSALAESLERGSADKAYSKYGLRKVPIGGKTGTAYNGSYTDVWFVGYTSAITCGVWAGFDSPHTIYRGAFSNDIALPIWVDYMNASFARYQPKEISRPENLQKYEICRNSGLLATDKCVETHKGAETGDTMEHRTTYFEWGTPEQAPKTTCDVHGAGAKNQIKVLAPKEGLRAELAVDVNAFKPVTMKAPSVVGVDPYGAIMNTRVAKAEPVDPNLVPVVTPTPSPTPEPGPKEPQVRQAQPAGPMDQPAEQANIELEPPPPIKF